jgi:hypothetical protein
LFSVFITAAFYQYIENCGKGPAINVLCRFYKDGNEGNGCENIPLIVQI